MSWVLTIGLYLLTFSPSFALFVRFVAPDPLRIILFVLGAFFWLVSLLISAVLWICLSLVWDCLPLAIGVSIVLQEAARVFYFWILKRAQSGLNKMTRPGAVSVAPGVSDLHNARHMLALVCGSGMGLMAGLFLSMNVFAEFSGPGSVGLPSATREAKEVDAKRSAPSAYLPLYYALSACLLTLFHVVWTILVWDSCHHLQTRSWSVAAPGALALATHVAVSATSAMSKQGYELAALVVQAMLLLICLVQCHFIMLGTTASFCKAIVSAFYDWATLQWIRGKLKRNEGRQESDVSEMAQSSTSQRTH